MRLKQLAWCLVLTLFGAIPINGARGQEPVKDQKPEQTEFEGEPDSSGKMDVKRPVKIPDSALEVLRDSLIGGTFNCLKAEGTSPAQAPASWFLASAIHLNGPEEVDLIVLPNASILGDPNNPGGCMLPAHGSRFWVLGPGIASGKYKLLLATMGLGVDILNSRSSGYRDIRLSFTRGEVLYKFTLQQYEFAGQKSYQ